MHDASYGDAMTDIQFFERLASKEERSCCSVMALSATL